MAAALNGYGAYVAAPNYGLGWRCNYENGGLAREYG
jgi:hypothetical protein